jgi:hypothetical protein
MSGERHDTPQVGEVEISVPESVLNVTKLKNQLVRLKAENEALREASEHAKIREGQCKAEAQSYRNDFLKCNTWCCDNGFGNSVENPVDLALDKLSLASTLLNRCDSLLRATRHSMDTEKPFPAMLKFTELVNDIMSWRKALALSANPENTKPKMSDE